MPADKPKSPPPVKQGPLLKDLPAQPVDEKEAQGVVGGIGLGFVGGVDGLPPDPCAPTEMNTLRASSAKQH